MVMAVVTQTCVGCGEQFTFTVKCGPRPEFCTKQCHSVSDKRKATKKKYQRSDKRKVASKKYQQSDLGKAAFKRHLLTDKGKASLKKYRESNLAKSSRAKKEQRRRAKKINAFIEDVDVHVLLDLQGGACFLCSQPILSDIKHPDPMSLSLDHIMPLARGGSHSYDNCAATHLRCNLVKGVKSVRDVAPLLRLVS